MIRKIILLLIQVMISYYYLYPQKDRENRPIFLEAESYFLFEEYNEALPLYLQLSNKYPENNNISYKIGVCYLNSMYEKEKSISYLERAVTDINPDYRENNFKETSAPLEALFALGTAYRINNQIDKALETYQQFKKQADPDLYDHELIDDQIKACHNALDMKTRPLDLHFVNLGDRINTRFSDLNPVVSGNETRLVYLQQQQFYDAVFFSEKINGEWSTPRNIIPELGVDEDAYPTALSYDGNILLIYRNDNFIGDLYYSEYSNGTWSTLTKFNDNINTKYWESHACLSRYNDTLYFTSNRKGSYGGLDIYYSVKDPTGKWGVPVNLGPVINTDYNEETPFITYDGKTLYFSSYGHQNMGGYDVFYSKRLADHTWSAPVNAGYPVNTTEDDIFYQPVQDGTFAYYTRFRDGSVGRGDIYKLEIFSASHPHIYNIKGLAILPAETIMRKPVTMKVIKEISGDTVITTYPDMTTGEFSFDVPPGRYLLLFEGEEIQTETATLNVPGDLTDTEDRMKSPVLLTMAETLKEVPSPVLAGEIEPSDSLAIHELADLTYHKAVDEKVVHPVPTPVPASIPEADSALKQIQNQYILSYIDQLAELSENKELKNTLLTLDPGKNKITSLQELYEYLVNNTSKGGYETREVNYIFSLLSQREELITLLAELTDISSGGLSEALMDLDPDKEKVKNPLDLMNYLLDNADRYEYAQEDALELLFTYLEKEDLHEIINILIGTASGPLQELLTRLNPESEGIINVSDLHNYLLAQARYNNYTESEVIQLFLNLLNTMEKKDLIKKVEPPQAAPVTAEKKSLLLYYLIGAGLLIILLIFIFRRRKDKKKKE
jgi:hypothetical protein